MADYWIKVYHEIIDDPKMATMADRLWRRTMEIFLLAGKLSKDKSGLLPDTKQLAWLLRMDEQELLVDLNQLAEAGIINKHEDGWVVTNFEKRQSATSDVERKRQQREREQKELYYMDADVTGKSRPVTQSTEYRVQSTEAESEAEAKRPQTDSFKRIHSTIQRLTGLPGDGKPSVDAIQVLVKANVTDDDIAVGVSWLIAQGIIIKYYSSIVGPAKIAMARRIQKENNLSAAVFNPYAGAIRYD